jgi:hypothetical protein
MQRLHKIEWLFVILIFCVPRISLGQQGSGLIEQLNQLNQALKKIHQEDQADRIVQRLWPLLDTTLTTYLDQNDGKPIEQMNKELFALLQEKRTVDTYHWAAEIKLYDAKVPGLVLAVYTDWPSLGDIITTLKVLRKLGEHWTVVGSMMESPVVSEWMDEAREEADKIANRPWHGKGPVPAEQIIAGVFARSALDSNGALIFTQTIRPLPGGGVTFVSRHDPYNKSMSEPTLIKWEWTPSKGLQAVGWIWGYKWGYDAKAKSEAAEWQTADKNKKGLRVKLQDLLRTQ